MKMYVRSLRSVALWVLITAVHNAWFKSGGLQKWLKKLVLENNIAIYMCQKLFSPYLYFENKHNTILVDVTKQTVLLFAFCIIFSHRMVK